MTLRLLANKVVVPKSSHITMASKSRILVVDDDTQLLEMFRHAFARTYRVDVASTRDQAIVALRRQVHCAAFVDISLSYNGAEGLELIRSLRSEGDTRVIVAMSGRHDDHLPTRCYDAGAYGFVHKPFAMTEAKSLLRTLLTLTQTRSTAATRVDGVRLPLAPFSFIGAEICPRDFLITFPNGTAKRIRPKAIGVLDYFARHAGRIVKRTELLAHVWGPTTDPESYTADVHISKLRSLYRSNGLDFGSTVAAIPAVGWEISSDANR